MTYNALSIQELGRSRLLVYKEDASQHTCKFDFPNVLPMVHTNFMGNPLCYFDISHLISLSELQKFTFNKYDLLRVLKFSCQTAIACTKEGIGLNELLFDPDYVFIDSKFNPFFVPLKMQEYALPEIREFLKKIVTDSIVDSKNTDNFVQILLNCFNENNFSLNKLELIIEELIPSNEIPDAPEDISTETQQQFHLILDPQNSPVSETTEKESTDLSSFLTKHLEEQKNKKPELTPPNVTIYPNTIKSGFSPVFSSETDSIPKIPAYNQNFETSSSIKQSETPDPVVHQAILFSAEDPQHAITIDSDPYRIGRNPEMVNYVIDSPYIGRIHSYIEFEDGQYYLTDNKSTNGTFLNSYRIPPDQRVPLKNGDIIRFAKHAFQFVLPDEQK